ncbi:hypothetical protein GQ43DRAFT_437716 [Delitschia confertaspora ATCC 74209]|uniref:Thioredoxin domain-containing protein n=1 Tax=Delitschia confertaspora ATCC 74209 TaxID=1513339 RepID=A0A9P4JY49_9PLEO|nr:hypothetical protein GQ43DRAFT_437716 [Delitschia confertaspora ATCC 74209]
MILRTGAFSRTTVVRFSHAQTQAQRGFFSNSSSQAAKNRIYDNVRNPNEFETLNLLSSSSRRPLITLWTASWCTTCQTVKPIIRSLIEEEGVGESEGGLGFTEIELDSVLIGDLPVRYMITSMPTLLSFDRQQAQIETRLTKPDQMKDKEFLRHWLVNEAKRHGAGGAEHKGILGWFSGR